MTGTAVGRKVRGGEPGEVGITVFVQQKKKRADLRPDAVVPDTIDGIATDVVEREFDFEKL